MTATKTQPGDDLHLTLLMAPHSLNFVTGADRAALLAYGRDVFAAARASQCLAQIEGPAQPVAEICSASHDDAQFGERAIKPLCDISGFEYGTPLYAGAAPAAVAPQGERQWICPTRTVADLVNNLLMMEPALPIYGAQYVEIEGRRRAVAVPPTVSRERVKDGRWIGQGEELNAAVVWTRAEQPVAAPGLTDGQLDDESYRVNDEPGFADAFRAGARFAERVHGVTASAARAVTGKADWWRGRADEIEVRVARSGSQEAMRCYTDMRTLLQAAAPALEAPGAREVTVERYEIPGGMRSALEDVISYLRSHGRRDLVRLMQELYTAISPWDGGSCSDVPDALVPARPDAEYLLSIAQNHRWPMLMRAHIKAAAQLTTAPALEAPAAPAVPAGFALVPIEPTQQMLDAGRWSGAGSVSIQEEWARKEVWSRMLATVTPPPAAYADDLVALVTELVQALRKATPDNDLAGHALDYLKRNGLQESPLRAADTAPQAPAAPVGVVGWVKDECTGPGAFDPMFVRGAAPLPAGYVANYRPVVYAAAPAAPAVDALSQAARDVLAERQRQISAEGYEPEADQMYEAGELARAAATYALLATGDDGWRVEDNWPWGMSTLKRAEPRRMLEKAGALILADMERLDRAAAQAAAKGAGDA